MRIAPLTLVVCVIGFFASGCASNTGSESASMQGYNNPAATPSTTDATSITINGFSTLNDGHTCAGEQIVLLKDTPAARTIVKTLFKGEKVNQTSAQLAVQSSVCDQLGAFEYTNVPVGKWIIVSHAYGRPDGGFVKMVETSPGSQTVNTMLGDADFYPIKRQLVSDAR